MGIHVLAIDFVTTDISRPYQETGGAICEVNTFPDLGVHLKVRAGTPRDAADAVLDLIYPPGKGWGFPVIAVLRDEADGDIEGALRTEWEGRGYKVAIASALATAGERTGSGRGPEAEQPTECPVFSTPNGSGTTSSRSAAGYVAAGKLTKPGWAAILGLSVFVIVVFQSPLSFLGLPAVIAAIVYLVDVRPAVRGLSRGGNNW